MKTMATGLLAALLAAACGSPTGTFVRKTGPVAGDSAGTLTFTVAQNNNNQTPQSATGGTGSIVVAGSISTAAPCWTVTAAHTQDPGDITVTVTATPSGQACSPQVVTFHNYRATLGRLAAGTYDLTVIHDLGGTATTAFDNTVVVR
jgi:hypothetical protein